MTQTQTRSRIEAILLLATRIHRYVRPRDSLARTQGDTTKKTTGLMGGNLEMPPGWSPERREWVGENT